MRRLPPEPQVGDRITAELVRELIRCIRERQLLKGPNYTLQTGPNGTIIKINPLPKTVRPTDKPLPFEVRWDATLNEGEGGYKIYLPTEHLLSYAGEDIATSDISGATPIPDANGDDTAWSVLDDIDTSADHVWLVVTVAESSGSIVSVDAEFAAEEGQAATGENVVNICIAEVSYEESENEGDPAVVTIKQSVVGALALGTGSDENPIVPDAVSTEFIPEPPAGTQSNGDEGELQIKGFKSGQPADTNTIAEYIRGAAAIPTGGIKIVCRLVDTSGNRHLFYLPLAAIWGDGSSGGLPLPEVTYLDDVTWDPSNHQLVKCWVKKNIATGVETPVQGAPQGKTATISTTPISSILPS